MSPRHLALLAVGVLAVSFSSVLIRLADAPPLSVAFYRNAMAAAVLLPLALVRHREEFRSLSGRQVRIALFAGLLLAAHFATWITSLSYTTVAASAVLVTSQPIWISVAGRFVGERVTRAALAGIGLALVGAVVISGGDFGTSSRAAYGDGLALVGAMCAAGYTMSGRNLRQQVSLLTYVAIVYTTCSVLLAVALVASGTPFTGFDGRAWLMFALLTIGPQIMGHTIFNYLLAHLEAVVVAVAIMAEPVGATLLALAILGETPPWTAVAGGVVVLAGVYLAVSGQTRKQVAAPIE